MRQLPVVETERESMPSRKIIDAAIEPLHVSHSKVNTKSCPNSFLNSVADKDNCLGKFKNTRRFESSPILEVNEENNRPILHSMINFISNRIGENNSKAVNTSHARVVSNSNPTVASSNINHIFVNDNDNGSKIINSSGVKPSSYVAGGNTSNISSNNFKMYTQLTDNILPQYTLMNYSNGPILSPVYPNNFVAYHPSYSGYSLQEYSYKNNLTVNNSVANNNNLKDKSLNHYPSTGQCFPSFFNPRTASNMPHKEKVNNWIENIPIFEVEEGMWESECYNTEYNLNWEEEEFDCQALDFEKRRFQNQTTKTNKNPYANATNDELLQLQAKKLDTLVRKLYLLEKDPVTSATSETDLFVLEQGLNRT